MMREHKKKNVSLQFIYLSISILSSLSVYYKFYVVKCSNIVGLMCFVDFYFTKKKDMIIHHMFVLIMLHYMNNHSDIIIRDDIVSVILSTEISTIFLITNTMLSYNSNNVVNVVNNVNAVNIFSRINKFCFVYSFIYYRIYKYYYSLIINSDVNAVLWKHSKNILDFSEIYIGMYGLFILNLYWCFLIFMKFFGWRSFRGLRDDFDGTLNKSIKGCDETKKMQ
jgi:hypothetical protein